MDWITGMQKAIDYIEANLTEEIDYEKVAAESFSSSYHFQRVFSILCGYTLGEYIRLRRLSLAGAELASGNEKVIDVALKYGYDSLTVLLKHFKNFTASLRHRRVQTEICSNPSLACQLKFHWKAAAL